MGSSTTWVFDRQATSSITDILFKIINTIPYSK